MKINRDKAVNVGAELAGAVLVIIAGINAWYGHVDMAIFCVLTAIWLAL